MLLLLLPFFADGFAAVPRGDMLPLVAFLAPSPPVFRGVFLPENPSPRGDTRPEFCRASAFGLPRALPRAGSSAVLSLIGRLSGLAMSGLGLAGPSGLAVLLLLPRGDLAELAPLLLAPPRGVLPEPEDALALDELGFMACELPKNLGETVKSEFMRERRPPSKGR